MARSEHRNLYNAADLEALIGPRSIAVVGASATGKGFGAIALSHLLSVKTDRRIYVIHPRFVSEAPPESAIGVTSVAALPEPVDCLIIAVPAASVIEMAEQAAERGCRSVLIFSAGFGEVEGGEAAEARLAEIARATGMRIAGPNTAGLINYRETLPLTFVSDLSLDLPAGNLAIVSQSAGLATHLGHRRHRGTGMSYTITTGNSVDVNALDYANALLDDPSTDVVILVLEGLPNPQGLAILGRKARAVGKPVLLMKTGRTNKGGLAAVSHTGSLAGSHEVFVAAAEAAGIPLFRTVDELIETAQLFACWAKKKYRPGGVGVLTTIGGAGVMAADAAEDHGVDLPSPTSATAEKLRQLMPAFAAIANPVDTTAGPNDEVLTQILEVMAKDANFSAIVMLAATMTGPSTAGRPAAIATAAHNIDEPIAAVWLSSWYEGPGSEVLDSAREIPLFHSSDRCLLAISHWFSWHQSLEDAQEDEGVEPELSPVQIEALARVLDQEADNRAIGGALNEVQSRAIFDALEIRTPRIRVAHSTEEAREAARELGFPLVAKVISADLPHKAENGGVRLALRDEDSVAAAFRDINRDVTERCPWATIEGVLIAEMIAGSGEFMCGMVRDPVFGPVVLCGAGGNAVEELNDVGRCVGPITQKSAMRALSNVRAFKKLKAKHASRADELEKGMIRIMQAIGAAAGKFDQIKEIDINPLVLANDGTVVALDALVVLE